MVHHEIGVGTDAPQQKGKHRIYSFYAHICSSTHHKLANTEYRDASVSPQVVLEHNHVSIQNYVSEGFLDSHAGIQMASTRQAGYEHVGARTDVNSERLQSTHAASSAEGYLRSAADQSGSSHFPNISQLIMSESTVATFYLHLFQLL